MLKGLNGDKVNQISNAIIELLQGQGGALSDLLSNTGSFSQSLADRYQVISDVIHNLNTVLTTVDQKSAQFNASVDQLQQLVTGLAQGKDAIAGAIPPLASAASDLTQVLQSSRRPHSGRHRERPAVRDRAGQPQGRDQQGHRAARRKLPAAQRPRRLWCVLQHLLLLGASEVPRPVDRGRGHPVRQRLVVPAGWTARPVEGQVLRQWVNAIRSAPGSSASLWSSLSCWWRSATPSCRSGRRAGPTQAYFADAGGISPGSDVNVSGIKVGQVKVVGLAGDVAKVTFTVDPKIRLGDQSLVSIKTDTILGEKSLAVTPAGRGESTTIPLNRTTTPYTLNNALQDLGQDSRDLDKTKFTEALGVLTDSLHDATPQLRRALDGVAALSRSINANDEALASLLERAKSVTKVLADRSAQVNQLVVDGNQLFAALDERRAALSTLIARIEPLSQQLSGFVADNRREFGPALRKLNAVLDNLLQRREHISEALKRLPPYATALGEVVALRARLPHQPLRSAAARNRRDLARLVLPARQAARQPCRLPARTHFRAHDH